MCSLSRGNPYHYGRQFKMHFFRLMPLFRLRLFTLFQAPLSQALTSACGALVIYSDSFNDNKTSHAVAIRGFNSVLNNPQFPDFTILD